MGPVESDTAPADNSVLALVEGDESAGEYSPSDDDAVKEKTTNPDLQQLKKFLIVSKAFKGLRRGMEAMVRPKNADPELQVPRPPGEHRSAENRSTVLCHLLRIMDNFRRAWMSFSRPDIPPGYRRVEWKCVSLTLWPCIDCKLMCSFRSVVRGSMEISIPAGLTNSIPLLNHCKIMIQMKLGDLLHVALPILI
jgi:hypothetical protein